MNVPTLEEVREHFRMLQGCCLHIGGELKPENIAEVLDYAGQPYSERERSGAALIRFDDGRYGVLEDGEDYTGHGCQCSSSLDYADTIEDARRTFDGRAEASGWRREVERG